MTNFNNNDKKGLITPNQAQTLPCHMRTKAPKIQQQQQIKLDQSIHINMIQIKPVAGTQTCW